MAKANKKTSTKSKKKIWIKVFAPKTFNEQLIGESPCFEKEELIGRKLTTSMMSLTRDMKKQGINITFEITDIRGENAHTKIRGYSLIPASVKRMMRKNRDIVDESFNIITKDKDKVRIKPLIITRFCSSKSIRTAIRKELRKTVALHAQKISFETLTHDIISNKLQKTLKDKLRKIYPINKIQSKDQQIFNETPKEEVIVTTTE
jgi:small subunit ribosomal protein S3Ae